MRVIRNSLLILISLTLILLIPSTLILHTISTTILEPYNTIEYVHESNLFKDLETELRDEIRIEPGNDDREMVINQIYNNLIDQFITKEFIASNTEVINNQFWDYVLGKSDTIGVILIKDYYDMIVKIAEREIESYSKSSGFPAELLKQEFSKGIEKKFPDSLDLLAENGIEIEDIDKFKQYYHEGNKLLNILYISIIIALILGALFSYRVKRIFRWFSLVLSLSGFITLIPIGIILLFRGKLYSKLDFSGMIENLEGSILNLFDLIIFDVTKSLAISSLIIILIGLVALILSMVLKGDYKGNKKILIR